MASLNMGRRYILSNENIDRYVEDNRIGNDALEYMKDEQLYVAYVGRSDTDLNSRLHDHVGKHEKFIYFKFSYAKTPREAYEKECSNFHDFGGTENLLNDRHPDHPDGKGDYPCPVCGREYILQ